MTARSKKVNRPTGDIIKKKRAKRHQFRSDYRTRAVFSFAEGLDKLLEAYSSLNSDDPAYEIIGLRLGSCYRSIGHSIEMLSKAILDRISPHLTLKKLDTLDLDFVGDNVELETCVAKVALARASKFLKKIEKPDLGRLYKAIEQRHQSEHREFKVQNFKSDIKELIPAARLVIKIYNQEFRNGHLLLDCEQLLHENYIANFKKLADENSKAFENATKKVLRIKKQGQKVVKCVNCLYDTAIVSPDGLSYTCLWCTDSRTLKKCMEDSCGQYVWYKDGVSAICSWHTSDLGRLAEGWRTALKLSDLGNFGDIWKTSNAPEVVSSYSIDGAKLIPRSVELLKNEGRQEAEMSSKQAKDAIQKVNDEN